MIRADPGDVSRAISAGLIRAECGPNSRGPGSKILRLNDAETISAAVRCGIPWQAAARTIDNLRPFKGGIVVLEGADVAKRNKNASTKLNPPAPPIPKCLLCGEAAITETEEPGTPFGCMACGAWGLTEDKVDNPPDEIRESGQVTRKPSSE